MEVIISVIEAQPGELIARHIHHGEEAFYVLQGATFETSDGKQITLPTGAAAINHRDVPHGGLKVVGDTPFKYLAVHVVDKGSPALRRTEVSKSATSSLHCAAEQSDDLAPIYRRLRDLGERPC